MKNKLFYLAGILITGLGDGIQQIALMWFIYHITGDAVSIGIMIAVYYLPSMFLTPFISVYVDHHDSKRLVVITDSARFFVVFVMAALIYFKIETTLIFYLLQFFLAICYTVYKPASQSFIKESFRNQDIPFVISKASSLNEVALLIGVGLSGVFLVKTSLFFSFLLNSGTFLLAAILFSLIKRVEVKEPTQSKIAYIPEIIAGWQYIHRKKGMKYLLFLSIINSISIQMTATLLLPLAIEFNSSSELYSTFEMAFSIGGITAGLIVTFLLRHLRQKIVILTMAGMGISSFLLYINHDKFAAVLFVFVLGLFTMSHLITIQTLIQLNTTKEYIGRVIGLRTILASFIKVSSALVTGSLISEIGVGNILLSFSLLIMVCFLPVKRIQTIHIPKEV